MLVCNAAPQKKLKPQKWPSWRHRNKNIKHKEMISSSTGLDYNVQFFYGHSKKKIETFYANDVFDS